MPSRSENPSAAALKQRAYRNRQVSGKHALRIDLQPDVIQQFVEWGWLSSDDAQNNAKLRCAVEELLECWASETLTTGPIVTT